MKVIFCFLACLFNSFCLFSLEDIESENFYSDRIITHFLNTSSPKESFTILDARSYFKKKNAIQLFAEQSVASENMNIDRQIYENISTYFKSINHEEDLKLLELEEAKLSVFENIHNAEMLNNKYFRILCQKVLDDIQSKLDSEPSITGHPQQLLSFQDYLLVKTLIDNGDRGFAQKVSFIKKDFDDSLSQANKEIELYSALFESLLSDGTFMQASESAIEAKKALVNLELTLGRRFVLKDLIYNEKISEENAEGLKLLFEYSLLRGKDFDEKLLAYIKNEHDRAKSHLSSVIEGGGPTGLMLALTQYEAGANVVLFEKRSMQYERTQIVRLDPKWMCLLNFYLGEHYYALFFDDGHKGVCREDGFGEIVTRDLEDALHVRLSELISLVNDDSLERLSAHDLKEILGPVDEKDNFQAVAEYVTLQDKGKSAKFYRKEFRKVDLLLCAGGKGSSMLKNFMPSAVLVNRPQYYGVCSWISKDFKAQNPKVMDFFPDFRGVISVDDAFLLEFESNFKRRIREVCNEETATAVSKFVFPLQDLWVLRQYFQTRTFENKGHIYIGMELPEAFKGVVLDLTHNKEFSSDVSKNAVKQFQCAWFDVVAKRYRLEESLIMDKNFTVSFPVEQTRLAKDHLYSKISVKGNDMIIMAAGDAFASPHFMRYSGLSGARESVLHIQEYVHGRCNFTDSEISLIEAFNTKEERTAQFVIDRGRGFLKARNDDSVIENRKFQMLKTLEATKNPLPTNLSSYLVPVGGDKYLLRHEDVNYIIEAANGYFIVNGGEYENAEFSSIKQLILYLQ